LPPDPTASFRARIPTMRTRRPGRLARCAPATRTRAGGRPPRRRAGRCGRGRAGDSSWLHISSGNTHSDGTRLGLDVERLDLVDALEDALGGPPLAQDSIQARAFPLAQPPFRRDGRRFGPRGKSVARLGSRACPAPRRGRPPSRQRRRPRWPPGAEPRLQGPVLEPWWHGRLPLDGVRRLLKPAARAGPVSAPRGVGHRPPLRSAWASCRGSARLRRAGERSPALFVHARAL
jgi:hypothetical protein